MAGGSDVRKVTWKSMGFHGGAPYGQEGIEEGISLKPGLERIELNQTRKGSSSTKHL